MPKGQKIILNDEQKNFIRENHLKLRYGEMARILGIGETSIIKYTEELCKQGIFPPKPFPKKWTKEEELLLIHLVNSKDISYDELKQSFNHSMSSILYKISSLKKKGVIRKDFAMHSCDIYKQYRHTTISDWSDSELNLLEENVSYKSLLELCNMLNKGTWDVLCQIRKINNVQVCHNNYHMYYDFSEKDDLYLIEHINNDSKEQILNNISHKTWKQILKRAKLFGIKRKKSSNDISRIELIMKQLLEEFDIHYTFQYKIHYDEKHFFKVDFYLGNFVIIETMGDYWHGNPLTQKNLNDIQREKIKNDQYRHDTLTKMGYRIFYFWERELLNDLYGTKSMLFFIKHLLENEK